jgi:hypothetical protein
MNDLKSCVAAKVAGSAQPRVVLPGMKLVPKLLNQLGL